MRPHDLGAGLVALAVFALLTALGYAIAWWVRQVWDG